jgi:hypothetical protein
MTTFRFAKWLFIVLTVCFAVAPIASAGVGFQPVSPEELKMTSEPQAPGAHAVILYRQVDRDDNIKTPHEDIYFRIKVLSEEGRKYANVEIPFSKGSEEIVSIHARTIRPDGSIADLGSKPFDKELVSGKTRGREMTYLAKTFTLNDVQVGSIIEYYYTKDFYEQGGRGLGILYFNLYGSEWILSNELFTKKARFSLKPYLGEVAEGVYRARFSIRWVDSLPAGAVQPQAGPDNIVRLEVNNIPPFQKEDFMPPVNELTYRVNFVYEAAANPRDQASYWKDFGKQKNAQLEGFVGRRGAMEQAVSQIVSPNDAPEVKLRKLYDRVQQFRNTSFEPQKTEQEQKRANEKSNESVNAEDVWKRGYGNRVELTWLFLGLARAAGFEAYGCWVSDRRISFFSPITMEGRKLDANVVLVKLNGKELYFDPGGAFSPFGLLSWSETSVQGLLLDKDGGTWIRTSLPKASESRIERTGKLKLSETGDLEGKLTVTYVGLEAMYRRQEERNADGVARKKFLEDHVASQTGAASQAELTNQPDWASSETPLVAEFNLKIPGWAANAGKRTVIPAAIFTAAEKGMFEHSTRVNPVYFEYPYQKLDDVTVELPAGWQVSSLPPTQDQDVKAAAYGVKVEASPGTLRLTRKLSIDIMTLKVDVYPALRAFFQAVRNGDAEQVVLQPGEVHASN